MMMISEFLPFLLLIFMVKGVQMIESCTPNPKCGMIDQGDVKWMKAYDRGSTLDPREIWRPLKTVWLRHSFKDRDFRLYWNNFYKPGMASAEFDPIERKAFLMSWFNWLMVLFPIQLLVLVLIGPNLLIFFIKWHNRRVIRLFLEENEVKWDKYLSLCNQLREKLALRNTSDIPKNQKVAYTVAGTSQDQKTNVFRLVVDEAKKSCSLFFLVERRWIKLETLEY